ncbi:hypothetical protein [Paenibacillus harenae]|uniref:hypothetical protein n=1 Tax=Paenibacillus harenae TaxID=306543 RepID=UPI0004062B8A|nr:hypothetical protein [Paenibacillus harenae]
MSDYGLFQEEKNRLDAYISRQFKIVGITENLSGATVELEHPGGGQAEVRLLTAEGRKYMSNLVIKQFTAAN